jgi:imidazolonepropionase-like amidohydrolase
MLIRLAEELGFSVATFQHVLEGYKVADEIAAHGAGASSFSDWWAYKYEVIDAIPYNGALLSERGVVASFNSDDDELARRLNLEAAKAVRYGGMSEEEALKLVTANPARQLHIDHRVGSLEPGKDADFVVWSGHPLSTYSVVLETWIDGRKYFDRQADLEAREAVRAEREALLAKVKAGKASKEDDAGKREEGEAAAAAPAAPAEPPAGEPAQPETPQAQIEPGQPPPVEPPAGSLPKADPPERPGRGQAPSPAAAGEGRGEGALPPVALVGATLHPVSGPPIERGVLVIEGGRITAVGPTGSEPPGAARLDLAGKHLYPGFLHPLSQLGLVEIESVRGTRDQAEIGDWNAHLRAEVAVNADSLLLPAAISGGVLTAHVHLRGGVFTGTSAAIQLAGWNWEDMTLRTPVGMHLRFPEVATAAAAGDAAKEDQGKARRELERVLGEARAYAKARRAAAAGQAPALDVDPRLEALVPLLDGTLPLFVHARSKPQIEQALDWTAKEGLTHRVLVAGPDASYLAERLAAEKVPVILTGVLVQPTRDFEPYDFAYSAPARLHAAGVRFAIAGEDPSLARNLPFHAAMAAAFGLPQQEALASVTLRPAEILGVADRLGSLDPGKDATFFVADGDPLEIRTRIERAWIGGREVDLSQDHQKRLYEKYRNRPRS